MPIRNEFSSADICIASLCFLPIFYPQQNSSLFLFLALSKALNVNPSTYFHLMCCRKWKPKPGYIAGAWRKFLHQKPKPKRVEQQIKDKVLLPASSPHLRMRKRGASERAMKDEPGKVLGWETWENLSFQ